MTYDSRFWGLQFEGATVYDLNLPVMLNEPMRIFDYTRDRQIHNLEIDPETRAIDGGIRGDYRGDHRHPRGGRFHAGDAETGGALCHWVQ